MLTSGGDAPGLNAVIRGAVLVGTTVHHHEFVGFKDGWKGLVENDTLPLSRHEVKGISKQGGTPYVQVARGLTEKEAKDAA